MPLRKATRVASVLALPILLGGCDLILAGLYPQFDQFGQGPLGRDPFVNPGAGSLYDSGTATLEVTRAGATETITLERLGLASGFDLSLGAYASWENDEGWSV